VSVGRPGPFLQLSFSSRPFDIPFFNLFPCDCHGTTDSGLVYFRVPENVSVKAFFMGEL